jgi:hypothetical protein
MIHRDAFREWASQAVLARRTLQGIPVREGEIEMMQAMTATVLPAAIAVGAIWLVLVTLRFRDNRLTSHAAGGVAGT